MQGTGEPRVGTPRVPIWRRLAERLGAEIRDRPLPPDTRLPPEIQLAHRFGVNRHTVRRAIRELAERGLVRVEQGRGCFVQDVLIDYPLRHRTSFGANLIANDRVPGRQVLDLAEGAADEETARRLRIEIDAPVYRVRTLGTADGVPLVVGSHVFPARRLPQLPACLAADTSFSALFRHHGIETYQRRSTRITARLPTADEAAALKQPASLPVLVTEAIDADEAGTPLGFGISCFASSRVQLTVER